MLSRSILRQVAPRRLLAARPTAAAHVMVPMRYAPAMQVPRFYSFAAPAEGEAAEKKTTGEEVKEAEAQLEKETKITEELEKVLKELEQKKQEAKDYKDKFTRAVADFRNLQDRTERDKKSAKDFAIQKFAKDLIESVDNLERALQAVPQEALAAPEQNKELVDFYNGLKMTEDILLNTLKKHGMEKVNPLGEVFDPNVHEATFQVPMPDKEPNTVFHVQQTGFLLNGRTIRAAKVGVVASPQN
ncbi:GrpE-domain-containing protein [Sphaerosporella brunnea]|uniref:GrpE protein homolog n=1 Tax=Sphaerosporella brunnea TaxID=1250544 RepID=A0A5J5EG61_9PEZI|nr:GrpE-domain-containing protein [Sphaerosporella brunnea]